MPCQEAPSFLWLGNESMRATRSALPASRTRHERIVTHALCGGQVTQRLLLTLAVGQTWSKSASLF
jgi:hypothetical protein